MSIVRVAIPDQQFAHVDDEVRNMLDDVHDLAGMERQKFLAFIDLCCRANDTLPYGVLSNHRADLLRERQNLDAFKQRVVDTVAEWEEGCEEGKRRFLDALDLEWPVKEYTVEVTFSTRSYVDSSKIEEAVGEAICESCDGDVDIDSTYCS